MYYSVNHYLFLFSFLNLAAMAFKGFLTHFAGVHFLVKF
jgi:hypothetical protein